MAATAERVKSLLWSFLSSSEAENNSKHLNQTESLQTDGDNPNGLTPRSKKTICPQDQEAYFDRVRSFTSTRWFAKPAFLSPLVCARYGWLNVEKDMLKCVTCKAHVSGHLPSSSQPAVVKACYTRLVDQLKTGHKPICPWRNYPSPEYFAEISLSNGDEAVKLFRERCLQIVKIKQTLPLMKKSILHEMGLNRVLLDSLVRLCSNWPEDCEEEHKVTAVVLSITGWLLTGKVSAPLVKCVHCNREVGLWNVQCFCHPAQTPDPDDMIPSPVFNRSVQETFDSSYIQSPRGNDDSQVENNIQLNLESAIDSGMTAQLNENPEQINGVHEDVDNTNQPSQDHLDSPSNVYFEPLLEVPGIKMQENNVDIGAMGDGHQAEASGLEESSESEEDKQDEEQEQNNTLESSGDSSSSGADMAQEVESSEEGENSRENIENEGSEQEEEVAGLGNANESGSSSLNRSYDSNEQDGRSLEDGSSDDEVPVGGVNVSGDDSDIEIVIMDSSEEEKSPEQRPTQVADEDESEEEEESEDDEEEDSESEQINDGTQHDDSGSESETEEQRGGGWGDPPDGEEQAHNISVEQITESNDGEEEAGGDFEAGQEQHSEENMSEEHRSENVEEEKGDALQEEKLHTLTKDHVETLEKEPEEKLSDSEKMSENIESKSKVSDGTSQEENNASVHTKDSLNISKDTEEMELDVSKETTEFDKTVDGVIGLGKDMDEPLSSKNPGDNDNCANLNVELEGVGKSVSAENEENGSGDNIVDVSEAKSPSAKHSCPSSAEDDDESLPAKKRQRTVDHRRPHFHPLKEHRSWCPWATSSQSFTDPCDSATGSPTSQSMSPFRNRTINEAGWKKVLLLLLPELSPNKSLIDMARTTPTHQSLRSIRQLFKQWQSPVTTAPSTISLSNDMNGKASDS